MEREELMEELIRSLQREREYLLSKLNELERGNSGTNNIDVIARAVNASYKEALFKSHCRTEEMTFENSKISRIKMVWILTECDLKTAKLAIEKNDWVV